jgi:UDP-N-acetylglucosamine diphosphorylase / glucose-1-phosphate thymidylyltransferase / UDP-N-acetylgalactosamine diphosphorylase / glucosamine-1-phosphate N-acetyltransferase / galactosamine-1-phosphate N-acetyltransferase
MPERDPTNPRYYFAGDPDLPFDLLSLAHTLPELHGAAWQALEQFLQDKPAPDVSGETIEVAGPVYIGAGTKIGSGVSIEGPVYIGRNCTIRHTAQLRPGAILGDGCVVGHSAEVKNSICMSGSKMSTGVFIGDSILGRGARIGSGTILSNRRFDQQVVQLGSREVKIPTEIQFFGAVLGDYSRLGANVTTAPGTLVGPYTWVASQISLYGFVPRAKLVLLKQELDIRDKEETQLRSGEGEYL